jgi:hypothetical protein
MKLKNLVKLNFSLIFVQSLFTVKKKASESLYLNSKPGLTFIPHNIFSLQRVK